MWRGTLWALAAAACFGISAPFSKLLLERLPPLWLAAFLYLGSGLCGLLFLLFGRERGAARPALRWFLPSLACGTAAPALVTLGLERCAALQGSLLLNLEVPFTAALAWLVFGEACTRRVLAGMSLLLAGGIVLSLRTGGAGDTGGPLDLSWGALAVAASCLAWSADNNFLKKMEGSDPLLVVALKGVLGGALLAAAAAATEGMPPHPESWGPALALGFVAYGCTLYAIIRAIRPLGAARAIAYFSVAPFLGALISIFLLGDRPDLRLAGVAVLMAAGLAVSFSDQRGR